MEWFFRNSQIVFSYGFSLEKMAIMKGVDCLEDFPQPICVKKEEEEEDEEKRTISWRYCCECQCYPILCHYKSQPWHFPKSNENRLAYSPMANCENQKIYRWYPNSIWSISQFTSWSMRLSSKLPSTWSEVLWSPLVWGPKISLHFQFLDWSWEKYNYSSYTWWIPHVSNGVYNTLESNLRAPISLCWSISKMVIE